MIHACYNALRKPGNAQQGLVQRAALIAAVFGIAHLAGLRQWVSALLEGTTCGGGERIGCCAYMFFYGSVVFVAPVLVLAALLLTIWDALNRRARA